MVFALISYLFPKTTKKGSSSKNKSAANGTVNGEVTEQTLLEEKRRSTFEAKDREERREATRRRREWEEVESSALGGSGLQAMPAERKRESTIGGVSRVTMAETELTVVRDYGADADQELGRHAGCAGE